ncbi:Calcium ATPase [Mycena venus]|uniref:Calcium ATPase n=1 Tax=Mycena venus TaxID=2733690 RepID=A0A8H6X2A8_9AGAR|nr:Calcium ATPase [Mycena venus]
MDSKDVEAAGASSTILSETVEAAPLAPLRSQFYRVPSVGSTKVDPRSKIPGDFRTLSVHVTETQELGTTDLSKGRRNVKDISDITWHTLSSQEVCTRLGVSETRGLDASIAARRLANNGKNVISRPPKNLARKIFFYIFGGTSCTILRASHLSDLLYQVSEVYSLSQASSVSSRGVRSVTRTPLYRISHWPSCSFFVIVIQAVFNAWQDYSTGHVMASIAGLLPTEVLVTRDGEKFKLPAADLVSGDIVAITLGSKVPADLRLLEVSSDLRFGRSILTGESNEVAATVDCTDKNFMESRNIALQGTLCTSGSGVGIAVGLGDGTVFGRIAKQANSERPVRTTLEIEIIRFVLIIGGLAMTVASFIVILWAAWLRRDYPGFINVPGLLIDCVSVAVAFIPWSVRLISLTSTLKPAHIEGLPVCVTLSLTVIARAMRSNSILCKSLSTVESLGAVNFIASDKTGTLTQNKMTAVNVAVGLAQYSVADAHNLALRPGPSGETIRELAALAGLCNDAVFEPSKIEEAEEHRKVNGDATDTGLLRFAESIARTDDLRAEWIQAGKISFNSKNKFALKCLTRSSDYTIDADSPFSTVKHGESILVVKGAPDVLLRRCSNYVDPDGKQWPLNATILSGISALQEGFAARGQRVLLLAKKVLAQELPKEHVDANSLEDHLLAANIDLTVVGLIALVDPPRPETEETVRICRRAGIRFAMVTGDFSLTAAAIARQVGIITTPEKEIKHLADLPLDLPLSEIPAFDSDKAVDIPLMSLVLSGPEMMTMTESQWKQVLTFDELVFARTSPQQKLQIVRAFQGGGCTVAVTGDGVNDAPALKQADVGVAMAGGSEVAMEAADLVLLSDNFSTIVTGIKYGRLCFENLRKSILYLLPAGKYFFVLQSSFSELIPVLLNVLAGVPQALSSIQMIIICVVTDVLPALSLVYEKPEADLLLRKPRNRKTDRLADIRLLGHAYLFLGILETLTSMTAAFYFGFQRNGVPFSAMWRKYGTSTVDPALLAELTNRAQSLYFFNLVIMQWFNLLSTRTRRLSLFQQNPIGSSATRNVYIFPAMLAALALACFFSYIPWFQTVFLTRGISAEFFFLPMAYGTMLLFFDESRKWWNRRYPKSWLARIAW